MPKLLTRYFVKELILYYFVSFLFFFMIFFVNQILLMIQDVLKQRVPVGTVLLLMLYCLPFVISQAAPFATLVGFLMCIARMVTDNEMLVLRALGISFLKLLVPVLVVGAFISVFSFAVNDFLFPRGALAYNKLYRDILISNPAVELETNSIKRTQDSILVTGNIENNQISDLIYFDHDLKGNQRVIVCNDAKVAQATNAQVLMQINMKNAKIFIPQNEDFNSIDFISSESTILNIFSNNFFGNRYNGLNPQEMTIYDLGNYIKELKSDPNQSRQYINIFEVEYMRKFALPFSSIFFAFLAFPLAVIFGKHNGQTVGFIVGVVICVAYWSLQSVGQVLGQRNGFSAFWGMWLPNFILAAVGLFFYARMRRT